MRVMQFLTVFESGGTERQALNLGLSLARRGAEVEFGCLRKSGRLLVEAEREGIHVSEYPLRSLYSSKTLTQMLRLRRHLRANRVDVLHAYNLYGNVFAVPAARAAGVPLVIAGVRDVGVYLDARRRRVQRWACRFADLILVNAEMIRTWLVSEGYAPDRIEVIRNGIDVSRFQAAPSDAPSIRHQLGIGPEAPLISTIARLCPTKGFEDAIDAFARIHAARPDAHHLIAGEQLVSRAGRLSPSTIYREALEQRARSLGVGAHVHFLGYQDNVPAILREVTVAMQPSLTEGLSNSVLEAMAAGRPVVATPVGGTPEVVVDGQTGWLAPVGQPAALADIVLKVLSDEPARRRVGEAARQLVHERLSIPAMVLATERLYQDRLERKHRTGDARLDPVTPVSIR